MTEKDWEKRFDQLMGLHLIDVPDDYYKDELEFKDPTALTEIFNVLEVDNLKMIAQLQANEEAYELLVQREGRLQREMDRKYVTQNANRVKLQKNIGESKAALNMSKKKIKEGTILMENSKDTSHASKKRGADADRTQVVEVDKMLDGLRKKIVEIYKKEFSQTEVSGKKTIDLLNEIEIRAHKGMKVLKNLNVIDGEGTHIQEKVQK